MAKAKPGVTNGPNLWGIEHVSLLESYEPVPVDNSSDATYARDTAGRLWVRKPVVNTGCSGILAEAIGLLLGRELGVPMPEAGVHGEGNEASWLSLVIKPVTHWQPQRRHFVQNMDGLGRALALDALLMNADRHGGNILLQPNPSAVELRAWCIDMGNAGVGYPVPFAEAVEAGEVPDTRNLAKDIPDIVDLLEDGARLAAQGAEKLSATRLQLMVSEACDVAKEPQDQVLFDALKKRLKDAQKIVEAYLAKVRAPK